jgi:hypothetical protein
MPETVEKREKANEILANSLKTDKEKLLEIFELFKEDIRNDYTMLYYALLGWRDSCRTKTSGSVSTSDFEK